MTLPTAHDFPDCRACQSWSAAGASWPRPCAEHILMVGQPCRSGHTDCTVDCGWCKGTGVMR